MFDKTGVKILGLIDNMSFFKGDDGKEYKIFGESGVEKTAKEFKKDFLGKIPLSQDLEVLQIKETHLLIKIPTMRFQKYLKLLRKR